MVGVHTFGYALVWVARSEERSSSIQCSDTLNEAVVSFSELSNETDRLTAQRVSHKMDVSAVDSVVLDQRIHNKVAYRSAD